MPNVTQPLLDLFAAHDVILQVQDDWLTTAGDYPAVRATLSEPRWQEGSGCSIRMDVEIALNEHDIIVESFSDFGRSPDEAAQGGLFNFSQSSLHVLLSALWQQHDKSQVLYEQWNISGRQWNLWIGNFVRKAANGVDVPPPAELFPCIESLIQNQSWTEQAHWLRVYFAHIKSEHRIAEFLVDNQSWEQGQDGLLQLAWPKLDHFYSTRLFLIMRPHA